MQHGSDVVMKRSRPTRHRDDVFAQLPTERVLAAAADLDGAPVTIVVTRSERPSVLAVPVNALLALLEGGYAVEVVDADGSTHLVAVETGLFDDGWVEVTGDGLEERQSIVVPS